MGVRRCAEVSTTRVPPSACTCATSRHATPIRATSKCDVIEVTRLYHGVVEGAELASTLERLPVRQPITDACQGTNPMGAAPGSNWRNQREHLVNWLREITGPGAYNRKSRNWDAKAAYNHFQCAPALLWLAEALGEDPTVMRKAVEEVKTAKPRAASQCAAV